MKNELYEIALKKVKDLSERKEGEEFSKWVRLSEKVNSPFQMNIDSDSHVIFYPKNSIPYRFSFEDKNATITVLHGVIYESIKCIRVRTGESISVKAKELIEIFTLSEEAYLKISLK